MPWFAPVNSFSGAGNISPRDSTNGRTHCHENSTATRSEIFHSRDEVSLLFSTDHAPVPLKSSGMLRKRISRSSRMVQFSM